MASDIPKDLDDLVSEDEEALIKDLNLDDIDDMNMKEESDSGGRSLPKKVELDIDDLGLEAEEPEIPPDEEPEPEPIPPPPPVEEEAEKPKAKLSKKKLFLFLILALIPILVGGGAAGWYFFLKEEPPPQIEAGPGQIEMMPFIVNFPGSDPEKLLELQLTVVFNTKQDESAFKDDKIKLRDLIYRFLQGKKPDDLEDESDIKKQLGKEIAHLINVSLKTVRVKQVVVVGISKV